MEEEKHCHQTNVHVTSERLVDSLESRSKSQVNLPKYTLLGFTVPLPSYEALKFGVRDVRVESSTFSDDPLFHY